MYYYFIRITYSILLIINLILLVFTLLKVKKINAFELIITSQVYCTIQFRTNKYNVKK